MLIKKGIIYQLILLFTIITNSQNLKIITYNIRYDNPNDGENNWLNRKDDLCAQLNFYDPDIFGIQEALPNQINDISNVLTKYNHVGIARDGQDKGEASNIFYKKENFTVIQQNTFWLSETPNIISKGWDAALNRICTYALFKNKKTKQLFWVFNTHLDHLGEVAKTKSIELIVSKIKTVNAKNYPVVFMGDFNSEPGEAPAVLLSRALMDTRTVSREPSFGPEGTFNAFTFHEPVKRLIDYIFVSENGLRVRQHAVLSDSKNCHYPSDHLPVLARMEY